MAGKLIFCKGLPGSGKSTWATAQPHVRVNKDDIRFELNKPWSYDLEKEVLRIRDFRIAEGLNKGKTVVSDDTNLAPKHETTLRQLAQKYKATFEVMSFLDVPIEECIFRDSLREGSERVGEKVIRDMAAQFIRPEPEAPAKCVYQKGLQEAIICDLDGTLAIHDGRGPFEYEKCDTDLLNEAVDHVLTAMSQQGVEVIFMSGREDSAREKTELWLAKHGWGGSLLYMRAAGDYRKDNVVKLELFDAFVRGKFNVTFVLDDRDQVVKMWRDLGLACFQVAPGNF